MKFIEVNLRQIIEICRRFNGKKLWIFGLILILRFRDESDIDVCVDFYRSKID